MRNIIICCDGTGNEISENISNVLKLYRCLRKTEKTSPRQLVFYDPGVGTLERPDPWHKLRQDFNAILGLATGYGLDDNVLAAYSFLVHTYQAGDQIYLFGFSRGAYTVRVLAGMIHKIGLITPEQVNLAGSGLIAYKQFSSDEAPKLRAKFKSAVDAAAAEDTLPQTAFDNAAQFARITSTRWPTIRFVGVWDTVASVIVPRADRFYWPSLEELAFAMRTPACRLPAGDLDRRAALHVPPQEVGRPADLQAQPLQRRACRAAGYFAGVVRRRASRYRRRLSRKAKRAFQISAALDDRRGDELRLGVNQATVNQLAWGIQRKGSPYSYVAPDVRGDLHTSLKGLWWILEYLPKSATYKEWPARKVSFRLLHPRRRTALHSRRRLIRESAPAAHGRDAELPPGEFAEAVQEVSDAGSRRRMRARRRRRDA